MATNGKEYMNRNSYYHNHKDKFLKPKIRCECGAFLRPANINIHKKTKKHNAVMRMFYKSPLL